MTHPTAPMVATSTTRNDGMPALEPPVEGPIKAVVSEGLKRSFDIGAVAIALLLFLPLIVTLIALLMLAQGRPVIYRHSRMGRGGKPFHCFKFRTMAVDGDDLLRAHLSVNPGARREWEATRKLKDDPRVTPLGRLLRKTSADERPPLLERAAALRRRSADAVWGEGFADDGWADLVRVDRWDLVHPDEFLRFFPGLVATAADAAVLPERLEQAVAVRWRRMTTRGAPDLALRSLPAKALARLGEAHESEWFPAPGPLRSILDQLLGPLGEIPAPGEDAAILTLDALLAARRAGWTPPYTEHAALTVAFHAGIHPAYLWSEAVPQHESATAVGWLGVVMRGRRAFLPGDIAATLAGCIAEGPEETGRLRDQRLALCGFTPTQWGLIGRAARRCLEGKRDVVRLSAAARPSPFRTSDRPHSQPAGAARRDVWAAITATRAKRRAT